MSADFTDTVKVEQRLRNAANSLHALIDEVGLARQVREFVGERRKTLLALHSAPLLDSGRSVPQAEALARSSEEYRYELGLLEKQYQHAERAIAKWTAHQATFEAARSLLSMSKETMRQLQG